MSSLLPRHFKSTNASKGSLRTMPPPPEQSDIAQHASSASKADLYSHHISRPSSDPPTVANYDSAHLTIGAGVAIFHLASSRIVLCYHSTEHYYFLPKGRKDVNEAPTRAAEREGFEESGYRNRLLPLPIPHRQPKPHRPQSADGSEAAAMAKEAEVFAVEPVWTQLVPVTRTSQYILFWYVAETLPPALETSIAEKEREENMLYQTPPPFEVGVSLKQRIALESQGNEPVRYENTGVDEEEALYRSSLMGMEEAIEKLGRKSVSADVVRRGWEAIVRRRKIEEQEGFEI